MNCNHVLGVHNSELIRCYTLIDPRVRPLVYNIKALTKVHHINDSSRGYLSSYAYVMMIVGFLQDQNPPILPSLQSQPREHLKELYVQLDHEGRGGHDLVDCSFDHNIERYKDFGAANKKTVGQLLIEFFEFYSRYFDYQTLEINVRVGGIRLRKEVIKRRQAGRGDFKPGHGEKKLVVMDPFIHDRNVAGTCSRHNLTQVWNTFQWLYFQLSHGHHQQAFSPIPDDYFRSQWPDSSEVQRDVSTKSASTSTASAAVSTKKKATHSDQHNEERDTDSINSEDEHANGNGSVEQQGSAEGTISKSKRRRARRAERHRRLLLEQEAQDAKVNAEEKGKEVVREMEKANGKENVKSKTKENTQDNAKEKAKENAKENTQVNAKVNAKDKVKGSAKEYAKVLKGQGDQQDPFPVLAKTRVTLGQ
ncbi:hypothetical protein BGZ94_010269 [Podila epigama]|nr:hypothetical protein BGZ94_010269 [Podila epigama]